MPKRLSEQDVQTYASRGYRMPLDVMSEEEARSYRAKLEATGQDQKGLSLHLGHLFLTWMDELIRLPAILDAVEDVLGQENLLCRGGAFFIKEPHDRSFISWHQDATYWGLSSTNITTVWLALSPSTKESGCVKFVPGTHLSQVEHKDTRDERNLLSRGQEVAVEVDEKDAVHAILKPGQASMHHVLLFHGSETNDSDDRRIGFAIRYTTPDVRRLDGKKDFATLVRGKDKHGNFHLLPAPKTDMDPDGLALRERVQQRS